MANFRTHIIWSSLDSHRLVIRVFEDLADSEVSQLNRVVPRQEYIGALNISVQHFASVYILEREAHLDEPIHDFCLCEEAVLRLPLLYVEAEVSDFTKLHHNY